MKKILLLIAAFTVFLFNSCVERCEGECDILEDGTLECPCDDDF